MAIPRYQQLIEDLLTQVANGSIVIGGRLPTEEQICAEHGLARGTVRQALERLEQLGMIDRRAGAGTVLTADRPVGQYQPFVQTAADVATLAAETRLVRPRISEIKLTADLAKRLGARAGTTWLLVQGVRARRTETDTPLCWSEQYLRSDLPREKFMSGRFTTEDVATHAIEQTISAALLTDDLAAALDAVAGNPALVITRRHRDNRGHLDSVGIHTHPADRYTITTTIPATPNA
jgi:DNA-binding GntR family transcriptional regulator